MNSSSNRYLLKIASFTETDDRLQEALSDDRFDEYGPYYGDGRKKVIDANKPTIDTLVKKSELQFHSPILTVHRIVENEPKLKQRRDRLFNRVKELGLKYKGSVI